MRRLLAIVLLAILPLQFSWAAVASYCGHETQAGVAHFGHHEHQHHADTTDGAGLDRNLGTAPDTGDGKALGAMDLDCSQCHGTASMALNLPLSLPVVPSIAPPRATLDESSGAHAPARPERPQWRLLA